MNLKHIQQSKGDKSKEVKTYTLTKKLNSNVTDIKIKTSTERAQAGGERARAGEDGDDRVDA